MSNRIGIEEMEWFRKPDLYLNSGSRLTIETQPYSCFDKQRNAKGDAFGVYVKCSNSFTWTVKVSYDFHGNGDGCGIFIKEKTHHWCCLGVEKKDDTLALSCTVFKNGYQDYSLRELGLKIEWIYLRIVYWKGNVQIQYSFNGDSYRDIRWFHFTEAHQEVDVGLYAQSPGNSFFDATFEDLELTDF